MLHNLKMCIKYLRTLKYNKQIHFVILYEWKLILNPYLNASIFKSESGKSDHSKILHLLFGFSMAQLKVMTSDPSKGILCHSFDNNFSTFAYPSVLNFEEIEIYFRILKCVIFTKCKFLFVSLFVYPLEK